MKKYLLLIAAVAILAGCSKNEVVDNPGLIGTTNKTYSMTVDLMAGQNIYVGTVSFYDPTDGNGGPLVVTYTLAEGWTMSESHVYAGPIDEMPVNKPGAPKIGKFPYQETHANVTSYEYSIPLGNVDMGNFAIAAHCVVNGSSNETGWASGDQTFSDKGWGTYISNFYSAANYVPNNLYGIQRTNDGTLNLLLIDGNTGNDDIIYSENITNTNGTIGGVAYDPQTGYLFFILGNGIYTNNLNNDDPTSLITTVNSSNVSGTTFYGGNYYYYDNSLDQIVEVSMTYNASTGWTSTGEQALNSVMILEDFTVTDITSYNNTIYLIGINSANQINAVSLLDYDMGAGTFNYDGLLSTEIDPLVGSPTIAAVTNPSDPNDFILYSINLTAAGEELVGIESDGTLNGTPGQTDQDDDDVILGR